MPIFPMPNVQNELWKYLLINKRMNEWSNGFSDEKWYLFKKTKIFPQQVRDCRLVGLLDLALEKDYVRTQIANYMNHLIDIGVAGFRLDASKHMWPGDIKAILDKLNNLNRNWFPEGSRPFIFQEVHPIHICA